MVSFMFWYTLWFISSVFGTTEYIILKNKLSYFCKDSDFVPFSSLKCVKAVTTWNNWSLDLVQSHRLYERMPSVRPKLNCSVSMIERLQAEKKSPILLTIFSRARKWRAQAWRWKLLAALYGKLHQGEENKQRPAGDADTALEAFSSEVRVQKKV